MTDPETRNTVINALLEVAPEIDPAAVRTEVPLQDQFDLDSMDLLQFLENVTTATGVEISERDYGSLVTLDDLFAYLETRVA